MRSMRHLHRRMPGRGYFGRRYLCDRPRDLHRLRHLRRRMPQRGNRSGSLIRSQDPKRPVPNRTGLFRSYRPFRSYSETHFRNRSAAGRPDVLAKKWTALSDGPFSRISTPTKGQRSKNLNPQTSVETSPIAGTLAWTAHCTRMKWMRDNATGLPAASTA